MDSSYTSTVWASRVKYLLLTTLLLLSGCGAMTDAKLQAWSTLVCKDRTGVYDVFILLYASGKSRTVCNDGTEFTIPDIHTFTHPTVKDYLPKD